MERGDSELLRGMKLEGLLNTFRCCDLAGDEDPIHGLGAREKKER